MIELRCAFHYLCVEACSDEEWDCRWIALQLHDCLARKRLMESTGQNSSELAEFESQAGELRNSLQSNAYFTTLKFQKKLLNGQTAYLYPIEDLAERAGLKKEQYRFLHLMFSSHVHGLPFSYFRMGFQERGRGLPSPIEESYTSICLACAAGAS